MSALPHRLEIEPEAPVAPASQDQRRVNPEPASKTLYLTGRPTLKHFLRFVKGHAAKPVSEGILVDEWKAARELVQHLEETESGIADNPTLGKLGPEYEPLLIEFLKDPLVRHGFNTVPTEVALVELDSMVVYQKHIDLTFVEQLESKLGPRPSMEQIFRTCLAYDHPQPPVKWSRVHNDDFVFVSPSNDLRFLGTMSLEPTNIRDYPPPGDLVGVVGIAVGFGSNFLNAIYAENRLILNNGSHRAYTLRKMGITHVPCIVQHVSNRDELDLVGSSEVRRHPDLYLRRPRPMMLRDYFDPKLHRVTPVLRRLHQVTVKFEIEENFLPAL